jgi:outer membrane protein OmpA-like peptidoglycan-associated protein
MKWILFLFLFFLYQCGFAQDERETYDFRDLIEKSDGKSIEWKTTSKVSGYTYVQSVKVGKWEYFDEVGNLIKTENYRKTGKRSSVKEGIWEYFSPDGERIKAEIYQNDVAAEVQYFQACIIKDNGMTYDIAFRDTVFVETVFRRSIKISETVYSGNIRLLTKYYNGLQQQLVADNLPNERNYGNPELLTDPEPNTHLQEDNLVLNPGFEDHPGLKFSYTSIDKEVKDVYRVSGSPDFYINNAIAQRTGEASLGFRVYSERGNDIEYFAMGLKDTLKAGHLYCFKFYLKLGTESNYAAKRIGIVFSNQVLRFDRLNDKIQPHIWLEKDWLIYKSGWMRMECTYRARGGEQFINIGTYYPDKQLILKKCQGIMHESYYYIEDVSVRPVNKPEDCRCNAQIPSLVMKPRWGIYELSEGNTFVLNDIFFDNDSSELKPVSMKELDKLVVLMQQNPTLVIEIEGHTSSVASRDYNLILSAKRAESVRQYLITKGIAANRMTTKGFGPDRPVADNETTSGQAKNRRVAFRVMKVE